MSLPGSFSRFVAFALFLSVGLLDVANFAVAQDSRPNIIIMMADDMGWGDVSFSVRLGENPSGDDIFYGGTTQWSMPNLDAMAAGGLTFSRMYSQSPVCSPTRASVLTGRAPQRQSVTFANIGKMQNREVTIAEYARALGYTTGQFGKWHLGSMTRDVNDANRGGPGSFDVYSTPLNNGFQVEYSTESKVSTHNPGTSGLTVDTRYWTGPGQFVPLNSNDIQGDDSAIIARETNSFIANAVNNNKPFLAVSWFHTPHKPTNDTSGNVDNLASYKFAMENLDSAIGQIRNQVQVLGIADNTILMFTSDNGPEDGQDYNSDGLRNNKRELHEGGVRVPGVIEWSNTISAGTTHTPMVTSDYLPTLLDIWGVDAVDDRPLDGISMVNTIFNDRDATRVPAIVFKSTNGHQSVIGVDGRYKLISTNNGSNWELYDLVSDHREQNSLADSSSIGQSDPETQVIFSQLLGDYTQWEASVAVSEQDNFTGDYENRIANSIGLIVGSEPPENLQSGDVGTGNTPRLYLERQHATLLDDTQVDSLGEEGTFSIADSFVLEEGLVVNSFLLHFNPTSSSSITANPSITFDDKILGVIGDFDELESSDYLSFADPNFEGSSNRRMDAADSWAITNDGYTIQFDLRATNFVDNARILTSSTIDFAVVPILGDANGDGAFNNFDIAAFVLALTNPVSYQAMFPDVDPTLVLDMNEDGVFDNLDIADFVAALTSGKK